MSPRRRTRSEKSSEITGLINAVDRQAWQEVDPELRAMTLQDGPELDSLLDAITERAVELFIERGLNPADHDGVRRETRESLVTIIADVREATRLYQETGQAFYDAVDAVDLDGEAGEPDTAILIRIEKAIAAGSDLLRCIMIAPSVQADTSAKLRELRELAAVFAGSVREQERQARLEARRRATRSATPSSEVMCVACGKRPRRIDDYCKRCAREAGIVVHGKIGDPEVGS